MVRSKLATMAAQNGHVEEVELLKAEVERLNRELDQASSEKVQSAQYGLVLLEEREKLQHKCDELESLYENTKHELQITQEVSNITSVLIFRCQFCIFTLFYVPNYMFNLSFNLTYFYLYIHFICHCMKRKLCALIICRLLQNSNLVIGKRRRLV